MNDLIYKGIVFGVKGKNRAVAPNDLVELVVGNVLAEIPGIQVRQVKIHPDGSLEAWGELARKHPRGKPFVESALEEIRLILDGAGFIVSAIDADIDDVELDRGPTALD